MTSGPFESNPAPRRARTRLARLVVEEDDALNRRVRVEHANLSTTEFRAIFRIANRILFRAIANPKRFYTPCFKALPAAAMVESQLLSRSVARH